MSGIEKEELGNRIKGMGEEELLIVSKLIPTDVLWNELREREEAQRRMIFEIKNTLYEKEGD